MYSDFITAIQEEADTTKVREEIDDSKSNILLLQREREL